MAELLSGWQGIAGTAIIISIILSGIALGMGRAFAFKRLERFGAEEIFQSIINAAILGFAVGLSALVLEVGAEFAPQMENLSCISNATPAGYALCGINATAMEAFSLSQNLVKTQNTLAYYQTLVLHFGNFSIQPLMNLNSVSSQAANSLYSLQFSTFALSLNAQFLSFLSSGWFGVIFASGLVLRSFFLSRRFGAFLIAVSISMIIFYPLALLMFPLPLEEISMARDSTAEFLSNENYQTIPIIDLNDNNAIAEKIYNMSFAPDQSNQSNASQQNSNSNDFTGDLTLIIQQTTGAAAGLFFYSAIVPLFALLATMVLIKELTQSFAGEIAREISQI